MSSCLQVRFLLLLLLPFGSIHCANITKSKSNEENKNQWRWETKRRNPENPEKRIVFQDSLESELSSSNSGSFTQNFCFAFFFFFFLLLSACLVIFIAISLNCCQLTWDWRKFGACLVASFLDALRFFAVAKVCCLITNHWVWR